MKFNFSKKTMKNPGGCRPIRGKKLTIWRVFKRPQRSFIPPPIKIYSNRIITIDPTAEAATASPVDTAT
jgi:hypothetical protein